MRNSVRKTNWDNYYQNPYKTVTFSRFFSNRVLSKFVKKYVSYKKEFCILEIGGANSCFLDRLYKIYKPSVYTVLDNNQYGLDLLKNLKQKGKYQNLNWIKDDILSPSFYPKEKYDFVFSVGLIEHFDKNSLYTAIANHFKFVKQDGIVIIAFPTPTFLYKTIRSFAEVLNLWIFHDEKPIAVKEGINLFKEHAEILDHKIVWLMGLTQVFFVLKKNN